MSATTVEVACAVRRLRLYQFRNYAEATVHFSPGVNVISGENAQGKSNLLEAVATAALTRSPRAQSSEALLHWGSDEALVEAEVQRPVAPRTIAARFRRDPVSGRVTRVMTLDGNKRAPGDVLGLCPAVLFWPDDLQLVKAGPEGRRRLLDTALAQLDRGVADALVRYRRVVEQRNALLKQLRAGAGGGAALPGFTRELVDLGAVIVVARQRLVQELGDQAAPTLAGLTAGRELLELRYATRHGAAEDDVDAAAAALEAAIKRRAAEEIARGVSLVGPHRDDLDIDLDGKPARLSASQGQQRTIVLALKVAEVECFRARTSLAPIVILDDVLSELDPVRRRDLMRLLADRAPQQVLLTTAEPLADLGPLQVARMLTVHGGQVSES